ncbi:ATP-binding cassette sub-family C member Sur isoform X2 [Drosophila pseudoobscura]|uniref:ATP-binding cassette sub-family C member Sur isoform X2 n=1 Tax=Drosophila pseudoobscura pseudoobscura TaxID=46245 RepID=A0A6I8VXF9_DROPS|nr:ATP-binding cassette sub-family C member Sur isoform X2 [Drosophila pseudoobscura]
MCHKTLLKFHNLRAAVSLLMLAGSSLDLARSLLPQRSARQLSRLFDLWNRDTNFLVIIGAGEAWNALASTILTILLMCYHRVIERKKKTVFLYASMAVEVLTLALRSNELTEVAYYEEVLELQTCLVGMSVLCLLVLASLDGYTIYNEHFRDNYVDDYGKIGYKHSLATFYSKSCFWWLTPLLRLGYTEPLELEDLGAMKLEDSARSHYDHFLYVYTDEVKKSSSSPSLWYCYIKNSWRMFALGGILKLAGDLFALIGPLAIQQIVQYIEELYATATNPSKQWNAKDEGQPLMLAFNVSDIHIGQVRVYYATWSELLTNGWSIAWIVLLAAITQGALSQASTHILNMTGIWIKTSLQGLIYRKTLLLNATSGCSANNSIRQTPLSSTSTPVKTKKNNAKDKMNTDSTSKEEPPEGHAGYMSDLNPSNDIGSITNHMTEDTLNIMQFFWIAHYAWAIPFKILVVIYLLYLKLGISAVVGAIVCILIMTPLQFLIGNAMSKNSEVIAKYTDERLKKIHETLIGIKIIKLNAWDEVFFKKIQVSRKKELTYLNKDALFWTLMTILTHISTVLITFVTLGVYVWLPREADLNLNASRLFSALALFQQLTVPLLIFPITVPIIIAARVSTRRLQRFFEASEIQKQFEGIRNMARILSKSDASLDMYETQEKSNMTMRTAQAESMLNEKHIAQRTATLERPISTSESEDNSVQTTRQHDQQAAATSPLFFQEVGHQRLVQQRRELLRNTPYVAIRPPRLQGTVVEKHQEFSLMRARNTDSWRRDSLLLKMPDDIAVAINDGLFTWHPDSHIPMVQLHIQGIVIPKGKLTIIVGKNGSGKTSLLSALLMEMPLLAGNMFWHKTCTISYVSQQPWLLNDTIRENILFGESFRPSRYDFVIEACALKPDIEIMPKGDFTIIGERGINISGGQIQRIAIARAIYSSANVVIMVIVMKNGRLQACGSYGDIESKHPQIPAKWNSIIATSNAKKQNDAQNHVERTASERWKLLKNVSKLGLQRSISVTIDENGGGNTDGHDDSVSLSVTHMHDNDIEEDEEDNEISAPYLLSNGNCCSFNLQRKRSSVYGSRHLIYDVPLPIDECQADDVIMRPRRRQMIHRRGSRTTNSWHRLSGLSTLTATSASSSNSGNPIHRSGLTSSGSSYAESNADGIEMDMPPLLQDPRIKSWQPTKNLQHQLLARNASSPPAMEVAVDRPQCAEVGIERDRKTEATSEDQVRGSFQQFLRRMSMRRSNKPKHHHQPLSATNSILSISEETAATSALQAADRGSIPSSPACIYNSDANDSEGQMDKQLPLMNATTKSVNLDYKDGNHINEPHNDCGISNVSSVRALEHCEGNEEAPPSTENELIPMSESAIDAERKYGKISHHIYLMYIRASGVPIITVFFITALIWQCLRVYTDVWLRHWSDVHIQAQDVSKEEGHEVTYYFCMYAAISCVCIIMAMISTPAGQWAGCNARRNLHDKLLQSILHKTLHFFEVTPLGRIVNRFSNDMAIIDKKIAATCQRLLQFSFLCISAVLINLTITPWFLAFTLPICGAYYIIQKFYRCSARELQRIENSTNSPVISHLSETIQGVTTIRAYNQQARFTEILFRRLEANTIASALLNTSNRWLGISLDYLGGCIVFVAIVTSLATASISCSNYRYARDVAETYANNKSMPDLSSELRPTPSLVGLAINYTLLVPIYLNWVVKLLADMEMYAGSVERIAHYAKGQESDLEANEEISNEVDSSSLPTSMSTAGDKVYPGATTAAVDVDEDGGEGGDGDGDGDGAGAGENADKLNAGNATGDGNHLNFHFHTATAADKLQKATTKTSVIKKDKKLPPHSGKVDLPNEPARRRESCQLKRYQSVPISWPQRGDISFQNVSLRYEGQTQNVISDLTLKIPAGQRIGICGRTGSGKSSLGLSLFGVLQTTSGHILIDEVDIKQIRPEELRTRLSIIPQDVHLFNTTIRENLDPHGYYSDLQLWNCLELAQLKEFVKVNLPLGLDTVITDGAINLSAGHRQLLCLARAILRGSVCLVLDEATSALDSSTEAALLRAADKAFQGRTIITIAHRLITILDYDRLIVMENGRIIEDGNPRKLQQLPGSAFQRLLQKHP